MKDELISFETAKLAKEKGFDIETKTAYIGGVFFESEETPNGYDGYDPSFSDNWNKNWSFNKEGGASTRNPDNINYFDGYSAPTQSLLQRWLREKHKIYVDAPLAIYTSQKHSWYVAFRRGAEVVISGCEEYIYNTYEEALEVGLQEALNLIKIKDE